MLNQSERDCNSCKNYEIEVKNTAFKITAELNDHLDDLVSTKTICYLLRLDFIGKLSSGKY